MKKIIYSIFVFIFLISLGFNFITVDASTTSDFHYATLKNSEKVYYEALEYMYSKNMFSEQKSLNLVESGFISEDVISNYINGSNSIYLDFENAKKAFFMDYEDVFYVEIDKLMITVFEEQDGKNNFLIDSGIYDSYLNMSLNEIIQQIKLNNEIIERVVRKANKITNLQEQVEFVLMQDGVNSPQIIKSILDELKIDNFIYEHVGSLEKYVDTNPFEFENKRVFNFYFNNEEYIEVNSSIKFSDLVQNNITISYPVNNFNFINTNKVQLLETNKMINTVDKLVAFDVLEEVESPDVYAYDVYQLYFYKDNTYIESLETSQMVLLPYPKKFAYSSTNVDYIIKKYNDDTLTYEEIESVSTVWGLVCEVDCSTKLMVEARSEQEINNEREIVILVSDGGNSSISKMTQIEADKNIKINVNAFENYVVEKINIDGNYVKFKPEQELLYVLNYEEVRSGSIIIIDFVHTKQFNENHKVINRAIEDPKVEITGSHYCLIGGSPNFKIDGTFNGNTVYEWYFGEELIARTNTPNYRFGPMTTQKRGEYKARVIITNGLYESCYETESFMLYDSVDVEESPFKYTVILCGVILIAFVTYVICDNASFKQSKRKNR